MWRERARLVNGRLRVRARYKARLTKAAARRRGGRTTSARTSTSSHRRTNRGKHGASGLASLCLLFFPVWTRRSFSNDVLKRDLRVVNRRGFNRGFFFFSNYSLVTFVWKRFGCCKNDGDMTLPRVEFPFQWKVFNPHWFARRWGAEAHRTQGTVKPSSSQGWCACSAACCWDIWPGICGYRTRRGSTATAGWTLKGITMRASSVRRTLTPRTPPCAAAPARCGTAARPRTHGWIRAAAPTTGRWTTPSLHRVSLEF